MNKILYIVLTFLFCLSVTFAHSIFNLNSFELEYLCFNTDGTFNSSSELLNIGSNNDTCNTYDGILVFSQIRDNFVIQFLNGTLSVDYGLYNSFSNNLGGGESSMNILDISSASSESFKIESNLNIFENSQIYNSLILFFPSILENNYYMKTSVFMTVYNDQGKSFRFYPTNIDGQYELQKSISSLSKINQYKLDTNSWSQYQLSSNFRYSNGDLVPYILSKPDPVEISFDFDLIREQIQQQCDDDPFYCGEFKAEIRAHPIDRKGAFSNPNQVTSDDIQVNSLNLNNFYNAQYTYTCNDIIFTSVSRNDIEFTARGPPGQGHDREMILTFQRTLMHDKEQDMQGGLMEKEYVISNLNQHPVHTDTMARNQFQPSQDQIDEMIAGKYRVTVEVDGCNEEIDLTLVDEVLFFCEDGDSSCDSVPDEFDMCPKEYGTPFFLGCSEEFIPFDENQPVVLEKELSCTRYPLPLLYRSRSIDFSQITNRLICSGGGGWFGHENNIYFNNALVSSMKRNSVVNNPLVGEYKCYAGSRLAFKCQLEYTGNIMNGYSVFDADRDGLLYHPLWWQQRFPNEDVPQPQDACPSSFGLVSNQGCPATNQEDIDRDTMIGDDLIISFQDFNSNKVYYNVNQSFIQDLTGAVISSTLPEVTSQVQVEVTSSCIPTVRISQLATNNLVIRDRVDSLTSIDLDEIEVGSNELSRLLESNRFSQLPQGVKNQIIEPLARVGDCDVPIYRIDNLTKYSLLGPLHLLYPVENNDITRNLMANIIETANTIQISKNINPIITTDSLQTEISFDISNMPPQTTIWQVIPKESVADFNDLLNSVKKGNADQIRIKDKDPIIGWYFGGGGDSGDIGFTIEGTGEGGSTIPMSEEIYFNFGDLIINYREFGCFENENLLFTTQGFSGSLVDEQDFEFSVCAAHRGDHIINSSADIVEQFFGIGGSQILTQENPTINFYRQSSHDPNHYYAFHLGRNPPHNLNHSCIGSIDESGLFGGCMYEPNNRIWVYYGIDELLPEIEVWYTPAHVISPHITVRDYISGLDSLRYVSLNQALRVVLILISFKYLFLAELIK